MSQDVLFLFVCILPMVIVMLVISLLLGALFTALLGPFGIFFGSFALLGTVLLVVSLLVSSFIGAAVIHVFSRLFHGTSTFSKTYKVVAYSTVSAFVGMILFVVFVLLSFFNPLIMLFGALLIPIVMIIISLRVSVHGIAILHSISKKKALVVSLIPFVVLFLVQFWFPGLL